MCSVAGLPALAIVAELESSEVAALSIVGFLFVIAGFALGLLVPRLFKKGGDAPKPAPTPQRSPNSMAPAPQEELWDQMLETCYTDFRVQALAGYDPFMFEVLHEPVYVSPDVVRNDSPMMPGELCLYEFNNIRDFRELWTTRRPRLLSAMRDVPLQRQRLLEALYDHLLESIEDMPDVEDVYWLSVRTPNHHHIVLFTRDLRRVIGLVPGLIALHEG